MDNNYISEFKNLRDRKRLLVEIFHQVQEDIEMVNLEIIEKSKNCNHKDNDDKDATRYMHPFTTCNICGGIVR